MSLEIFPLTLEQANQLVDQWHRHHKPVRGHRFSIGVANSRVWCGAAIVGRPVARETDQYAVAEVTRLVTDGTKNACSKLYSACARICAEMGFTRIQTFILDCETGTSLQASGWEFDTISSGGDGWQSRLDRRDDQPIVPKQRWRKELNRSSIPAFESPPGMSLDDIRAMLGLRPREPIKRRA